VVDENVMGGGNKIMGGKSFSPRRFEEGLAFISWRESLLCRLAMKKLGTQKSIQIQVQIIKDLVYSLTVYGLDFLYAGSICRYLS